MSETVLSPASRYEVPSFIVGVGTVAVVFSLAYFWIAGLPRTPDGLGRAFVHTIPATIVAVGGHELAHYIIGESYCGYDRTTFAVFDKTLGLTVASAFFAIGAILVDTFVFGLPPWILALVVASPGAVIVDGRSDRLFCDSTTALAGPAYNAILGVGLWWMVGFDTHPIVFLTTVGSCYLAVFNAMPFPVLDGREIWDGSRFHQIALLAVVASATYPLATLL